MKKYIDSCEIRSRLSKKAQKVMEASDPFRLYEENGKIRVQGEIFSDEVWNNLEDAIKSIEFSLTDRLLEVELFGQNLAVEFCESEIFECDEYEKNVLVKGIWIAFDEAIGEWVQVGTAEQYWQSHTEYHQY